MQNKWQSGMSNRSNIYSFGFQFRSCFLLTVMKMSQSLVLPPVNDLAIATVFYERHLLLPNQLTGFFTGQRTGFPRNQGHAPPIEVINC